MDEVERGLVQYALSLLIANLDADTVDDLNEKFPVTWTEKEWEDEIRSHPMFRVDGV